MNKQNLFKQFLFEIVNIVVNIKRHGEKRVAVVYTLINLK